MKRSLTAFVIACLSLLAVGAHAQNEPPPSTGQTLYLPIYSSVALGDLDKSGKPRETPLAVHVSLRNTDPRQPVKILSVRHFDPQGRPVRELLSAPQGVPPLGSHEVHIPRADVLGGSAANLLILWTADVPVNPLLAEALHADSRDGRAVAFVTTALPIRAR
jgi:hypothetical protein